MDKKILLSFPTNFGDVVMSLPALNRLKANHISAHITVIAAPQAKELLERNSFIDEVLVFDKKWPFLKQLRFTLTLRHKYHIFIDMKNTLMPLLVGARLNAQPYVTFGPSGHIVKNYIDLVKPFCVKESAAKSVFALTEDEVKRCDTFFKNKMVFLALSSRSSLKCYSPENTVALAKILAKKYPLALLGEAGSDLSKTLGGLENLLDLSGMTSLWELFYILKHYARLVICVDSSILHISSYLDLPQVALFGPTDQRFSFPWGIGKSVVLRDEGLACLPSGRTCLRCVNPARAACMDIAPQTVADAAERILDGK